MSETIGQGPEPKRTILPPAGPEEMARSMEPDFSLGRDLRVRISQLPSELLSSISDREMTALNLTSGMMDGREKSLEEAANEMGVTARKVQRLADRAFKKLFS